MFFKCKWHRKFEIWKKEIDYKWVVRRTDFLQRVKWEKIIENRHYCTAMQKSSIYVGNKILFVFYSVQYQKQCSMQELWNTPSVSILMEMVLLETSWKAFLTGLLESKYQQENISSHPLGTSLSCKSHSKLTRVKF